MVPSGYRLSHLYHKALNPTTVPIIIDNNLFILTEQLSRHVVDTKLSFLIPHPQSNNYNHPIPIYGQSLPNTQWQQPNQYNVADWSNYYNISNSMNGNIAQQLHLERMHAQFAIDSQNAMNSHANKPLMRDVSSTAYPLLYRDQSTYTYDLNSDVEMKSVQ